MAPLQNDTLLRALLREPTPYTPVWLMRQAGRYLPEYVATRKRAGSFLALAKTPELATEVTLQPLERYPLDAAILFSDILTIPDAMGLGLYFNEGEGPRFERPLRDEAAIRALAPPDPTRELRYVLDAVAHIRTALAGRVPLIGFSGSPFTLACYMVEGGGSDDFRLLKSMLYGRPDLLHRILAVNARAVADYLNAQIEAGAQVVMIFDTWGGTLAEAAYHEFSLAYIERVWRSSPVSATAPACRASSSPRAAGCGWKRSPGAEATPLASTGRSTSARRAGASVIASRCRETSIRSRFSRHPMRSGARLSRCLLPSEPARDISSIWDMACPSTPRPSTSVCWWTPSTRRAASSARDLNLLAIRGRGS
jgi:uroporphyrinogen decarboxylase